MNRRMRQPLCLDQARSLGLRLHCPLEYWRFRRVLIADKDPYWRGMQVFPAAGGLSRIVTMLIAIEHALQYMLGSDARVP